MKRNILFIALGLVLTVTGVIYLYTKTDCTKDACCKPKGNAGKNKAAIFPSCNLTSSEQIERGQQLKEGILKKIKSVKELDNGYDLSFNEPVEYSKELIEFVNFERKCCPYFTWGLIFEPNNNATHLQIYGSQDIKNEIKNGLKELGVI